MNDKCDPIGSARSAETHSQDGTLSNRSPEGDLSGFCYFHLPLAPVPYSKPKLSGFCALVAQLSVVLSPASLTLHWRVC